MAARTRRGWSTARTERGTAGSIGGSAGDDRACLRAPRWCSVEDGSSVAKDETVREGRRAAAEPAVLCAKWLRRSGEKALYDQSSRSACGGRRVASCRAMIDLTDRVVLITGAAGGIGAATARTVARLGGDVVAARPAEDGRAAASSPTSSATGARRRRRPRRPARRRAAVARGARVARPRRRARQQRGHLRAAPIVDGDLDAWTASWERTLAVCLVDPGDAVPRGDPDVPRAGRRRHRSSTSPAGPRSAARIRSTGTTRPPRRASSAMTQDDRAPVRPRRRDGVRRRARLRQHAVQRRAGRATTASTSSPRTPGSARWPARRTSRT